MKLHSPDNSHGILSGYGKLSVKPLNLDIELFPMANKWAPSEDDILKKGVESFSQGLETKTPVLYTPYTKALQR